MSVINQMLQDLERRHAGPEDRFALPDEVRPLPAVREKRPGHGFAGWSVAIAAAGLVAWLAAAGGYAPAWLPQWPGTAAGAAESGADPAPAAIAASVPGLAAGTGADSPPGTVGTVDPAAAARVAQARPVAPIAGRISTELSVMPASPRLPSRADGVRDGGRDDRMAGPDRTKPDGARPDSTPPREARMRAERAAANAETDRLARAAAASPGVISSFGGAAGGPLSGGSAGPTVASMAAPLLAPAATPLAAQPAPPAAATASAQPSALPTSPAPPRTIDTSPPRIDRQEREPTARERADASYRRGVEAMHEGRATIAEQALREALAISPSHEAARQTLLGIFVQQRRSPDAEALLMEGQRQNPSQVGFALALARLQVERSDLGAALETLQRSAAAGRDRADFLGFHAGLLARAGRHGEAVQQYRAALRYAPQTGVWWMGLGMSLEADRRAGDAVEAFQRARDTGSLNAELTAFVDQRLRGLQSR